MKYFAYLLILTIIFSPIAKADGVNQAAIYASVWEDEPFWKLNITAQILAGVPSSAPSFSFYVKTSSDAPSSIISGVLMTRIGSTTSYYHNFTFTPGAHSGYGAVIDWSTGLNSHRAAQTYRMIDLSMSDPAMVANFTGEAHMSALTPETANTLSLLALIVGSVFLARTDKIWPILIGFALALIAGIMALDMTLPANTNIPLLIIILGSMLFAIVKIFGAGFFGGEHNDLAES